MRGSINEWPNIGANMPKYLSILADAPDFELIDTLGNLVRLSDYLGKQEVVLVLLRGFT
jgi:hypothetical protein